MARPVSKGQVDRFTWAMLLLIFGVFLLINREAINWIGFLIAAGFLVGAALFKQSRGLGTDVLGLIFGIVLAALGVGKHYAVDIPWIAIAAIAVAIMLLFEVFRKGKTKKGEDSVITVSPPNKEE
ncbi:MAG TPA: hypothetical protein ENH11_05175 [Candidatus Acetothermia bacterium]|nr:hypothetical protein [Candidatus Acetothermia bacterium]